MTLPPPIFNDFFRNPFGGERNPIGGMGGEGGVLENIQQQVSENGQALQALQGGIGGLPNTPFQPATLQPVYGGHRGTGSPGTPDPEPVLPRPLIANQIDPSVDFDRMNDLIMRAEYDKAVAEAKKYRETSPLSQEMLPGEMSFEDFKKNIPGTTTLQNLALVQSPVDIPMNPPTDLFNIQTDTRRLMTMNNDFFDPRGLAYGNVGNPIPQPIYERPGPDIGMDQLFGRAFAGKPI